MSNTLHHDLMLSMAAVWVVRDDEDPITFSRIFTIRNGLSLIPNARRVRLIIFFQKTGFAGLPTYTRLSESELQSLEQLDISAEDA